MGQGLTVSPEMIQAVLAATNRHFGGPSPIQLTKADLMEQFAPEAERILGAVEELLELLPNAYGGTMEVKWGHDDEGTFGSPVPNEGDGPDSNDPPYFERVEFQGWDVIRTANAVYICPHGNSGGPVAIWFTPYQG